MACRRDGRGTPKLAMIAWSISKRCSEDREPQIMGCQFLFLSSSNPGLFLPLVKDRKGLVFCLLQALSIINLHTNDDSQMPINFLHTSGEELVKCEEKTLRWVQEAWKSAMLASSMSSVCQGKMKPSGYFSKNSRSIGRHLWLSTPVIQET